MLRLHLISQLIKSSNFQLIYLITSFFFLNVYFYRNQQQQLIDQLKQVFGNRPNLTINVDTIKPVSDLKCQAIIYIEEKSPTNTTETKRILATETGNYLNQPMPKSQITSLGIEQITPLVLPDEDQLKEYLENSPKGK